MKIKLWVEHEVELDDHAVLELAKEGMNVFETDAESLEGIIYRAIGKNYIEDLGKFFIEDDEPLTLDELQEMIDEQTEI